MAKKNYKITLTLTDWGKDNAHNPDTMDTRIAEAVGAAGRNHVNGKNDTNLDRNVHREPPGTGVKGDGTIVWHVHGELADVNALVGRWTGNADPADPLGHLSFRANVSVSYPEDP